MTPARVLRAVIVAGLCAAFLGTTAYVNYSGLRVRAVKEPIAAGPDGVHLLLTPEKLSGLASPFAVIANLRNDSSSSASIAIRLDDQDVCVPVVAAGQVLRADCQFNGEWNPAAGHTVAFSSAAASWGVEAFELSRHHGSNAGIVRLFVLPAASRQYETPGIVTCLVVFLLVTGLLLVSPPAMPKPLRFAHRVATGLFAFWVIAVVAAPLVSPYRVIVSAGTVYDWMALCLVPQLYCVVERTMSFPTVQQLGRSVVLRSLVVAGLVVLCFAVVTERRVEVQYNGNHSGLLLLSRQRIEANPWIAWRDDVKRGLVLLDNLGYDGQFMYAIAFDPFLLRFRDQPRAYHAFIDTPPYRYGRIGYPALTRLLALGRLELFPGVMIGLIYAGAFLAAFVTGWLARQSGASEWWGFLIALVPGFWASFGAGLPEPLAAGAAVAGYLCVRQQRWIAGALFLAAACLIRETAVILVVCIAGWLAMSRHRRPAIKILVLGLVPLVAWRLYVGWVFSPGWGLSAYWTSPDDFGAPFVGIASLWADLHAGRYYPDLWEMRRGITWYSLLVLTAALLSWIMLRAKPGAITAAASIFGVMAICFNAKNVWVQTVNAERLSNDLFLMLAIATPSFLVTSRVWRLSLVGFWLTTALYLLFGTLDASFTRHALIGAVWH